MDQEWRRVFVANGETEARQVQTFLEAAGIVSKPRGEALRKTHGLTLGDLGKVEIVVSEADEPLAREILAAADRGDFRIDSETPPAEDPEPE